MTLAMLEGAISRERRDGYVSIEAAHTIWRDIQNAFHYKN
jgi:hypothetical protein